MGHENLSTGSSYDSEISRAEIVDEKISRDFLSLFTYGGILDSRGEILSFPLIEAQSSLPEDIQKQLDNKRVIKEKLNRVNDFLDEDETTKSRITNQKVFIFSPGAIEGLAYRRVPVGRHQPYPTFINKDGSSIYYSSTQGSYLSYLALRVKNSYEENGLRMQAPPLRITREIMISLAEKYGMSEDIKYAENYKRRIEHFKQIRKEALEKLQ